MNEIKAQEHLKWLDEQIKIAEKHGFSVSVFVYKQCKEHFKSLITKPYDPDHDSAV